MVAEGDTDVEPASEGLGATLAELLGEAEEGGGVALTKALPATDGVGVAESGPAPPLRLRLSAGRGTPTMACAGL